MKNTDRAADNRSAVFQGRLDLFSALLPRSNEFIRSGVVNVIDIEVGVQPGFSFDLSAARRNRYREDSTAAHKRFDFLEACLPDQLIELPLRTASHYPGLAFAIRQYSGDHLNLWVPRLAGIDEITAFFHRISDSMQASPDRRVVGE